MGFRSFEIIFIIVGIISASIFVFTFLVMFSPKIRAKMMSKNVKATKYMVDQSKDDIKSISSNMAEARADGVETTARAIKKGLTEDDKIFCKYCGEKIDSDSKFCNKCGKEL